MNKKYFSLAAVGIGMMVLIIGVGALFNHSQDKKAVASSGSGSLSGFAWTEGGGWISFSSADCHNGVPAGCPGTDSPYTYGVSVDQATGLLSGYAYSENIGWISFNQSELGGCPSGTCKASAATTTTSVILNGWARACAGTTSANCSTTASRTDGWDGWISLGASSGPSIYTTYLDIPTNQFKGKAWGGDVLSWISFNCLDGSSTGASICATSNYHVDYSGTNLTVNIPDAPTNLTATKSPVCGNYINLSWTPSTGAVGYRIWQSPTGQNYSDVTIPHSGYISGLNPVTYTDYTTVGTTTYYYYVRAYNDQGTSTASNDAWAVSSGDCGGGIIPKIVIIVEPPYIDPGGTIDYCPNIALIQYTIPAGKTIDPLTKNCVDITGDVCPNIAGTQTSLPDDKVIDSTGDCVDPIDLCHNLPGIQLVVPEKYYSVTSNYQCYPDVLTDVCTNLPGIQTTVPPGYSLGVNKNCFITDYCPNLEGVQTEVPLNYIVNDDGTCSHHVDPPCPDETTCPGGFDFCRNLPGTQTKVPDGAMVDAAGMCYTDTSVGIKKEIDWTIDTIDVCPNIPGVQSSIPNGYVFDFNNQCKSSGTDMCPNIAGNQVTLPDGQTVSSAGNCVNYVVQLSCTFTGPGVTDPLYVNFDPTIPTSPTSTVVYIKNESDYSLICKDPDGNVQNKATQTIKINPKFQNF